MNTTTIMVVDDQPEYLRAYATCFFEESMPFKIISATNGEMALQLAQKEHPDIIIMDWHMPVMDGLTALKKLRKIPVLNDIPVILASGIMLGSEDLKQALEAGASDYIRKPIDKTELLARTHSHLRIAGYIATIRNQENEILKERDERIEMLIESSHALSQQIEEMIHILMKERDNIIDEIHNFRKSGKPENEIVDIILQYLTQNQQVFRQYTNAGKKYVQEDGFIRRLLRRHSTLLPSEIELCLLLRKNLSSKEIASLTFKAPNTIKVARSRLRQKLGLKSNGNLYGYLNSI